MRISTTRSLRRQASRLMLRMRASLAQMVRRCRIFALVQAGSRDHLSEHRDICDATISRNKNLAVELLGAHYDVTTKAIIAKIEEIEKWAAKGQICDGPEAFAELRRSCPAVIAGYASAHRYPVGARY